MSAEIQKDHYRILGVGYDATSDEIEEAYHELARKLHPDVTGDDAESTARYMAVTEAYRVLSRRKEREEYDKFLGIDRNVAGKPAVKSPKIVRQAGASAQDMRLLDAKLRRAIRESAKLCRQGSFWEATRLLEMFLKTHSENPGLRKALASAAFGRKSYHEAVNHMKVACKIEYHDPENFVRLAEIYLEAGQLMLAERAVNEALAWNTDHEGAKNMLRRIHEKRDEEKPLLKKMISKISKGFGRK